jgi:serine protease Do
LRCAIDAKRRAQEVAYDGEVLLVDCITSNPGSPGGALLTVDGRLAGMVGKLIESQNTNTRMNYAVPVDLLKRFVEARGEDPAAGAREGAPYLGLRLFTLSGTKAPAYIDRVVSGSPAEAAGLRKDDLILALGEDDVRSIREYQKVEEKLRPGQQIVLSVKRQHEFRKFTLMVAARPKEGAGSGE